MIRLAETKDKEAWNNFIGQKTHHAFRWEWRTIIEQTFKHVPYYFIHEENAINAVLPTFLVNSPLFGSAIISMPYLNAGGILSNNNDYALELITEVKNFASKNKVSYLELRAEKEELFF